jgi:hypothetical protein
LASENLRDVLLGTWYYAGEENTAAEKVYRRLPEGGKIPPGRARDPFRLNPDGTLVAGTTAPNDARVEATGTWELDGDQLTFYAKAGGEPTRVMKIASATKERLLVKK